MKYEDFTNDTEKNTKSKQEKNCMYWNKGYC